MQKNHIGKILTIGIIVLFVGVGIHPAFAVETKQSMANKASEEECWECKEIDSRHLVILERQLNRLEVYTKLLLVLSRYNPELKEISEDLSNEITTLKEELTDDPPFPLLCEKLENIILLKRHCVIQSIVRPGTKIGCQSRNYFFIWM